MRKLIVVVLAHLFFSSLLLSQSFINIIEKDSIRLDSAANAFKNNLFDLYDSTGYFYVHFDSLENHIDSSRLDVNYSDSRDSFFALPNRVFFENENNYEYSGMAENGTKGISLISHENGVSGVSYDHNDSTFYYILPLEDTLSIFIQHKMGIDSLSCELNDNGTDSTYITEVCDSTVCNGKLTVLLLYPSVIEDWLVDSELGAGFFMALQAEIYCVFAHSKINHRVELKWDMINIDSLDTGGDCYDDAAAICDNESVDSLRTLHKGDVVMFIAADSVEYVVLGSGPQGCGSEFGPNYLDACMIIPIQHLLSKPYIFTHEIGHMYGTQHKYVVSQDTTIIQEYCAFGYKFKYNENPDIIFSTIMASGYRIPYFSDPNIEIKEGVAVGTDVKFAAGRVRMNGCILQNFKPEEGVVTFMKIEEVQCSLKLSALVLGTGNYTYKWYSSYDGLFSSNFPGDSVGVGSPDTIPQKTTNPCEKYFIKLVIFENGEEVASDVRLQVGGICSSNPVECDDVSLLSIDAQNSNPYKNYEKKNVDIGSIDFYLNKNIRIFSLDGRLVWHGKYDTNTLLQIHPTGIYIIMDDEMNVLKVFIN